MSLVVEADAVSTAEGHIAAPVARPGPKVQTQRLHRGQRAGHVHKGCPGTGEVPLPPGAQDERAR